MLLLTFLFIFFYYYQGSFQAFWKDVWASTIKLRPDFGTCPNASTFDADGNAKRLAILRDPNNGIRMFDSKGNLRADDLNVLKLFTYIIADIIGSHFMLRGQKEPSLLIREDFLFTYMTDGYYEGCPCVHLRACHAGQKQKDCTLSNTARLDVTDRTNYQPLVRLSDDPLDPYNMFEKYFFLYLPSEDMRKTTGGAPIRLFQFPAAISDVKAWQKLNLSFLFAAGNNPWGKTYFNTASKKHAETFGYSNPKRCTSHGRRKQGVTKVHNSDGIGISTKLSMTRHGTLVMGATYDHGTRQSHDNAISALQNNPIPAVRQDPRPSMQPLPAIDTNAHRHRNTMPPPLPLPVAPPTERPSPQTEPTRPPLDSCYTGLADRSAPPPRHLHHHEETVPPTEHTRPPLDSCYTGLADRSAPPPRHLHHHEETPPPLTRLTRLTRQRSRSLSQSPSKRLRGRTSGT